ncbi:MAG: S8 family serine peptidase [Candidatus Poseidoniales archaeon]
MTTKVLKTAIPVLLALLMLPLSGLVSPTEFKNTHTDISYSEPLIVDSAPPLICGEILCPVPDRMYQRDGRAASEQWGWWFSYGPDEDANGMDDRLQRIMDGRFESQSPTAIIGPDGQKTVAIIVDWAWHPSEVEQSQLKETLFSHGWIGQENGAWWQVLDSIDSITVDKVPLSALVDIWSLEGVVVIEQQNVMVPFLDTATPAVLARPSDTYSNVDSAFEQGYTGSGVVIAILDTGVDNEHRSLNDFDDQNDEPDLSATSYDDPKWVAGYDATSSTSQQDGTADPDDGAGHGSHCAGIALGTGDARGVNMGAAPGAYLVDVKVLTDFGGTNSQSSVNGIQWVINNKDTNWGNNGSSIGIQIASMSFGSVSNPTDQDDTGNNGTESSAENRLVNNASANGVVMVAAMGNDGARRVPSPAAADSAITVGAINNRNTVNRSDDTIASYSNYGPRDSDDDNDDWDELKPDVSSPGSGIMSVSAATGSSIPGQPRPMADNEYESKDGTSMSTPLVSGVIALVLEANPTLDPYEVKDLIRNYSQVMGSADLPSVSDKWDDHWGFGMIDASCLVKAARGLECDSINGNGNGPPPPPNENGTGEVVNITIPVNGSWMITEKMTRIKGSFDESLNGRDFVDVHVRITRDGGELMTWTKAGGSAGNWLIDFKPESSWGNGEIIWIEAKAKDTLGDWSESVFANVKLGEHKVSFTSPSGHDSLIGDVTFGGTWEGIEPSMIQYRVDAGDWSNGDSLTTVDYGDGNWNIDWDSETVDDGTHRFTVRLENQSEYFSDELRRSFIVDNEPPAPELSILGGVKVLQHGVDVSQALTLTHLIVEADIINNGDSAAKDLEIRLYTGSQSQSIDQTISYLGPGQVKTVQFIWKPLLASQRDLSLEIDPSQKQGETNISNNNFEFTFDVLDRPDAIDLTMFEGACVADPRIPQPNKVFELICRIDNFGKKDAVGVGITLMVLSDITWELHAEKNGLRVPGSVDSAGYLVHSFAMKAADGPLMNYRVELLSDDFNISDNKKDFTLVIDDVELLGDGMDLDLDEEEDEVPRGYSGHEEGGHLLTSKNEELHVRTITNRLSMPGDVTLDTGFSGSADISSAGGGLSYIVWTRKFTSSDGYTMSEVAFTTVDEKGQSSMIQRLMPPLKHNEGEYWGLTIATDGPLVVIGGYHRDIATGGTYQDMTNLFLISTSSPADPDSWAITRNVLTDVDTAKHISDPPAIGIGEEKIHILYQAKRDDITGIQRMGLFYSHGRLGESAWSFHLAVGDEVSSQSLVVKQVDGEDVLIATWKEGLGINAKLANIVNDASWSIEEPYLLSASGLSNVVLIDQGEKVQVLFDVVDVYGDAISYGIFTDFKVGSGASLSSTLLDGRLALAGISNEGSQIIIIDNTGEFDLMVLADTDPEKESISEPSLWEKLLKPLPGDDAMKEKIGIGIISAFVVMLLLVSMVIRRANRKAITVPTKTAKKLKSESIEIMLSESDLEEDAELEVSLDSTPLVEEEESRLQDSLEEAVEADEASERLRRRMQRVKEAEYAEKGLPLPPVLSGLPLPPPPMGIGIEATTDLEGALDSKEVPLIDGMDLLPPPGAMDAPSLPALGGPPPPLGVTNLPALERQANCDDCEASFTVKDLMRKRVKCPICNKSIEM